MFKISTFVNLTNNTITEEELDKKYNTKRTDLRKFADFTNETPEQVDQAFAPPAPSGPIDNINNTNNNTTNNNTDNNTINTENTDSQTQQQQDPNQTQQVTADSKATPFVGVQQAKEMYQNGLISSLSAKQDYWDDNSSEFYVPHSDWNSPSSAIWSPAAANLYGRF